MSARTILRGAAALTVMAACLLPAAPALAATDPAIQLRRVAWDSTLVQFRVTYPAGTAAVSLAAGGVEATRVLVATETAGTVDLAANMAKATSALAGTYAEDGSRIGTSAPLAFDARRWAPRALKVQVVDRQIVGGAPVLSGYADARTTAMSVSADGKVLWKGKVTLDAEGRYRLPRVPLEYGVNAVRVAASNVWGSVTSPRLRLWNLGSGASLRVSRWVLVDKSDLALYVVKRGLVDRVYPVAIGMPGTPTPTGLFVLGRPQAGGGSWGILRMPLYWPRRWGLASSTYFIHGTNDSSSIGTMASHGCVRMYNEDVVRFARDPGSWVYVKIRE
jgi:lipoprotein-anchoring transpeptidase ErfK/SrfK